MGDETRDPFAIEPGRRPVRLHSEAATAPPDPGQPAQDETPPIRLTEGDRTADVARAAEDAARVNDELAAQRAAARAAMPATSHVERTSLGTTGTGLVVEEVEVVDPVIEGLRGIDAQIAFVQVALGRIVTLNGAPYGDDTTGPIAVELMEHTDRVDGRDLGVILRVLRGKPEPEPHVLIHAVSQIVEANGRHKLARQTADAQEQDELAQLAAEANALAREAGLTPPEPMSEEALETWVFEDAIERSDDSVGDDLELEPEPDDGQVDAEHTGTLPPEPLLTQAELDALNEVVATPADYNPVRVHRRHGHRSAPATQPAPASNTTPGKGKVATEVKVLAGLFLLLLCLTTAYLARQDVKIRTTSETRDAAQDVVLTKHGDSLERHARTLAQLVPVLAEKDAEILDLTNEKAGFEQVALESQSAIRDLDRAVDRKIGTIARDLSDNSAEMRRQRRELEELRAQLEAAQTNESQTSAPAPE